MDGQLPRGEGVGVELPEPGDVLEIGKHLHPQPGRLLLVVNGQVVKDQAAIDSTPLDRLIAFSKHTRFRVDSERTMRSVFMDGYTIVRVREEGQPAGLMLVEAIGSERSLMSGSLRFIKTLLLPF